MKIASKKRKQFDLDETDVIMWNESIYQLMTHEENDKTYPVLKENEVRELINNKQLIQYEEYVSEYTKVPITLYKLKS